MKRIAMIALMLAFSAPSLSFAQSSGMQAMDMKDMPQSNHRGMAEGMDAKSCQDMMTGMDMKNMDAKSCQNMMKGMGEQHADKGAKAIASHAATGIVKAVDPAKGTVTLAHEPVKSLNWPAMTMSFAVKDKKLFDKLAVDKTVNVEFVQQGGRYVVTAVK